MCLLRPKGQPQEGGPSPSGECRVCRLAPGALSVPLRQRELRPGLSVDRRLLDRDGVRVRSSDIAGGPLSHPDVVAPLMEPDSAPGRKVALDLYVVGRDWLLTCHADPAGSGAVPCHAAVLLRQVAGEDLLANPGPPPGGITHAVTLRSNRDGAPTRSYFFRAGFSPSSFLASLSSASASRRTTSPIAGSRVRVIICLLT